MDIITAIDMAKKAFDTVKALQEVDHQIDKAELKARLVAVMGDLSDVRMALINARETVAEKDAEIARLRSTFDVRADLVEWYDFKYRRSPTHPDLPLGYPICSRCEAVDGRVIFTVQAVGRGGLECPQCKQRYMAAWQQGKPPA